MACIPLPICYNPKQIIRRKEFTSEDTNVLNAALLS